MPHPPERPPLLQPSQQPPEPGSAAPTFRPAAEPAPVEATPRRIGRRAAVIASVSAFVLLISALSVQTWRLERAGSESPATPGSTGRTPTSPPSGPTTPSTTPGTSAPPLSLPNGFQQLGDVPGIRCLTDLLGTDPTATIRRNNLSVQIDSLATWVEKERDLRFTQLPEPALLTPSEMAARVQRDVEQGYGDQEADLDARLLVALGAAPPGIDMRRAVSSLLAAQVLGFYDPTTKQLVVASNDGRRPLKSMGEVTLAHELDHALTDNAVGLPSLDPDTTPAGVVDTDKVLARRSLGEGDATLITNRFILSAFTTQQQMEFLSDPALRGTPSVPVPKYLESQLLFPYQAGLEFACALKQSGGWRSVNAAYSQPPSTSAQILFPERFAARDGAIDPPDPGALNGPWAKARAQTFGAADLWSLYQAPGDNPASALRDPKGAVAAWGGGETVQWTDGDRSAVGLSLSEYKGGGGGFASGVAFRPRQTPSPAPAPRLCDSVRDWYSAAFPTSREGATTGDEIRVWDGDRQDAVLRCVEGNIRLGIGPDVETARTLVR